MKKKTLIIAGTSLMLLIFIAIMGSGYFLKNPITKNDDVLGQLDSIEKSVHNSDWSKAEKQINDGLKKWGKVKNRIQFSVERDFLEEIDSEMAEIKGAIIAKDQETVITNIEKLKVIWKELGK